MTQVYRLCSSAYKYGPSENGLHSQLFIHVSSPSTTNNEGGGWVATGPIGTGITFSTYVEATVPETRAVNRALVAADSVFYLTGDNLFKARFDKAYEGPTDGFMPNAWDIVHTFTQMEAGRTGRNTGLYYCVINATGVLTRYIVGAYNSTVAGANTWKGFRYDVDTGLTTTSTATDLSFAAAGSAGGVKAEVLFNNKLYFIGTTDGGVGIFDPQAMTLGRSTWPTTDVWGPHDFCPYKGRLYCLNRGERGGGGGSGIYIWDVTGPPTLSFNAAILGFGASSFASEQVEGRSVLFTDKEYLYAGQTSEVSSVNAFRFLKMSGTSSGNFTLIGQMPSTLSADGNLRVDFFTEQNSNPDLDNSTNGQLMTLMADTGGASGVARAQYAWGGPTSAITTEENVNPILLHTQRATARSNAKAGGGERIWDPLYGGPRVDIVAISGGTVNSSVTISYKIYSNEQDFPVGTPCSLQVKYDTNQHMPYTRAVLYNPSVGTLAENNTVIRTTATNGSTSTVEWLYGSNGVSLQSRPIINMFIATTGVS